MAFDILARRLAWIEVKFASLESKGDDVAEPVEHVVQLQVELVDLDEFGRLFVSPLDENGQPRPKAIPPATPERIAEWEGMNDTKRALALVRDWRGIRQPFNEDNLRAMMRVPNFGLALFHTAYPLAYAGQKETRTGNSDSSPANGPASVDAAA